MAGDVFKQLKALALQSAADSPVDLPESLATCVNKSGITLFKYHTIPDIQYSWEDYLSPEWAELRAGLRWGLLIDEQEQYWREQTELLLAGDLTTLQPGGAQIACFDTRADTPMALAADNAETANNNPNMVDDTLSQPIAVLANHEDVTSGCNTPILDFLSGSQIKAGATADPVAIITHLAVILAENPNMVLKCRRSGMRINYDPESRDVTSIFSRLSAGRTRSLTAKHVTAGCKDTADHFEYLLRPLLFLNRNLAAFEDLKSVSFSNAERATFSRHYSSLLHSIGAHSDPKWRRQFPLSTSSKHYIVRSLLFMVRKSVRVNVSGYHRTVSCMAKTDIRSVQSIFSSVQPTVSMVRVIC